MDNFGRINKEIRKRIEVVGVIPNETSHLRLISIRLLESNAGLPVGKRFSTG